MDGNTVIKNVTKHRNRSYCSHYDRDYTFIDDPEKEGLPYFIWSYKEFLKRNPYRGFCYHCDSSMACDLRQPKQPKLWICLLCSFVICEKHVEKSNHWKKKTCSIAIDNLEFKGWCYECNDELYISEESVKNTNLRLRLDIYNKWLSNDFDNRLEVEMTSNTSMDKEFIIKNITTGRNTLNRYCNHSTPKYGPVQKHCERLINKPLCLACKRENTLYNDAQLWMCLQCANVSCGRHHKGHAVKHWKECKDLVKNGNKIHHSLVMDIYRFTFWCYECDDDYKIHKTGDSFIRAIKEIIDTVYAWTSKYQEKNMPILSIDEPCKLKKTSSMDNKNDSISENLPKVGGLINLGNTCFFNSVLQCLAQTPYLVKVLKDLQVPGQKFVLPGGKYKGSNNEEMDLPPIRGELNNKEDNFAFTSVLLKTLTDMQTCEGKTYRPSELLHALRNKTQECTDGGQHDAHELLRHLLECVRGEDVKRYQSVILKEYDYKEKTRNNTIDDCIKGQIKFYGNQANSKLLGTERVFRGELVSSLQCQKCRYVSTCKEPFLDLSLPINMGDKRTMNWMDSISNNLSNSSTMLNNSQLGNQSNRGNRRRSSTKVDTANTFKNNLSVGKKKNESEESDADVEDNSENDDALNVEIGESGYSSEKPSAITSPASPENGNVANSNANSNNTNNLWHLPDLSSLPLEFSKTRNDNSNNSPSPTDIQMTDVSENEKTREIEGLSNSVVSSPEGLTVSSLSSPLTSKDSLTSPSSAAEGDEIGKSSEKLVISNNGKSEKLKNVGLNQKMKADIAYDNSPTKKKKSKLRGLTTGVGDVSTNLIKLDLSSREYNSSFCRYDVKDGERSVQACLNQFTDLELMNGKNKVACDACTEKESKGKKEGVKMICSDSTKQYLISRVPAILILHLKRFQANRFYNHKIGVHVSFPMLLDLSPVSTNCSAPAIYALYGIVEHSGHIHGGHYVAYVKSRAPLKPDDPRWSFLPTKESFENTNSSENVLEIDSVDSSSNSISSKIEAPPGQWYYVSDSCVSKINEKDVLKKEAYLLFYERIL